MGFADPMPNKIELDLYNSNYFSEAHGVKTSNTLTYAFYSGMAYLRMHHIQKHIKSCDINIRSILEYGPGPGLLAKHWLETYPETTYSALESDISCHRELISKGVNLIDESSLKNKKYKFDLVIMSHVLEHVANPFEFLKTASEHLVDGGVIFVEVPCKDWIHKLVDEPHLLFFDKPSIKCLFEKLEYECLNISYHGKELMELSNEDAFNIFYTRVRNKLLSLGLIMPFSSKQGDLQKIPGDLERAMIKPTKAHYESINPAWWLRIVARKNKRLTS
jgi:SAM-dependent methyltransferase